jgi:hypothetical protein
MPDIDDFSNAEYPEDRSQGWDPDEWERFKSYEFDREETQFEEGYPEYRTMFTTEEEVLAWIDGVGAGSFLFGYEPIYDENDEVIGYEVYQLGDTE